MLVTASAEVRLAFAVASESLKGKISDLFPSVFTQYRCFFK